MQPQTKRAEWRLTLQLASRTPSNDIMLRDFIAHSVVPHHNHSSFFLYYSAIEAAVRLEHLLNSKLKGWESSVRGLVARLDEPKLHTPPMISLRCMHCAFAAFSDAPPIDTTFF